MVPKFANPHSLSQDVEATTRADIAERAGLTSAVHDEDSHTLRRSLDDLLRDTWAGALTGISRPSRAKKRRRTAESYPDDLPHREPLVLEHPLVFRLVSSMTRPQHISLDPKPPPPPMSREPDWEDSETQAEVRRTRALSVAVEVGSLGGAPMPGSRRVDPKSATVEHKIPLPNAFLPCLPPLLVTEEVRTTKRVKAWYPQASESPAASPHEPRSSCVVLPVTSVPNKRERPGKKRRKATKERPAPAYWRPSPGMQGKCMGYALGYPSSWAPDRPYVRDGMKRGVLST